MAVRAKHQFTSNKADGADDTLIKPSNWNADHPIILSGAALVGKATAGDGEAVEITVGDGLAFSTNQVINNDKGSTARQAHESASDPHPQYLTQAEGDTRYPRTVNGVSPDASGNIAVAAGKAAMTLVVTNATTTAETIVARWAIPANTIEANDGIQIKVKHQSAGTATVIYRLRIGAAGTTADTLLSQNTTSAAQVANAQGQWQGSVFFPATNQARGGGFAIQQAVVLGQTTAAQATATINPAAVVFVSVTVQLSAAQASVTTAAVASWGDQ